MKDKIILALLTIVFITLGTLLLGWASGSYWIGFIATLASLCYSFFVTIQEVCDREKRLNSHRL